MILIVNGASVLLGLAAWALPAAALLRRRRHKLEWLVLLSLTACAASLLLQLYAVAVRCAAGDFAGLDDTAAAIAWAAAVQLAVTAVLNTAAVLRACNAA